VAGKIITDIEFVKKIQNSKTFAINGFRVSGTPQELLRLLRNSFNESGQPHGITIIFSSSPTDPGVDILADEGLIDTVIASFFGSIPKIRNLIQTNKIKGYSFPQGQISLLFREIARGSPGLISEIGINSFVDPQNGGGKLNTNTKLDLIERVNIINQDYLLYKSMKIDVALLRGTCVDVKGNISMAEEPIKTEFLAMAQAAKSSGGRVYVQVLRGSNNNFSPNEVDLPAHLVDGVLISSNPDEDHRQSNLYKINPDFTENVKVKSNKSGQSSDPLFKQIIAKRAVKELVDAKQINLGQGLPELVGNYLERRSKGKQNYSIQLESGVIGGIPERRPDFGVSHFPDAFLTQDNQFASFNGGLLDVSVLSFAQVDRLGNINVSLIGDQFYGAGGFIDIVQKTKTLIFVGSFTAKDLNLQNNNNSLSIEKEGLIPKFVKNVSQITYSSELQSKNSQVVKIITERCVFVLKNRSLIITEIAPGIELENDILNRMAFKPEISSDIKSMEWN